ncbi:hypothetical protein [Desulfovibrio sp. JC022]|uniref:hypothetical protein n=1 Tax=Desulfovibrio sp. JC022 TaxID=2593642 RepID=UPI0013D34333|nr:hypothetical protein [Desulfovibrio sp. JC022]NDV24460.1 hypothetical protein [Desulfovibrio sp. JC022]
MWKSIIITTALMLFGLVNAHAADFGYPEKSKQAKAQTITSVEKEISFSDIITGLNISDEMSTGLIFGLDGPDTPAHDGPDGHPGVFGLGLGFNFSF